MRVNLKDNLSDFYCTRCGQRVLPLYRRNGRAREPGHLKKLWCLNCKDEVNCCEVRENNRNYTYEDFQKEYTLGRFKVDGTRDAVKDLLICSDTACPYNQSGRCWNSNYSFECKRR